MKRNKIVYIAAVSILSLGILSGCTSEREENQTSYRQIGINNLEHGDYEGAVEAFDNALAQCVGKIGANEIDICYYKAAAQYASGKVDEAISTYTALLDYDEENADAYYLRGCLLLKQQKMQDALSDFEKAVTYQDDSYELYVSIYENLSCYDNKEKGEEYLQKAFSIKGNSGEDFAWRGRIYYLLGQYDNAVTELNVAVEKKNVAANLYLGQVYNAKGDSGNAKAYYETYLSLGEADAKAFYALGEIEMENANYTSAIAYFEQGMSLAGADYQKEMMQNLIICYEYGKDFSSAWEVAQEYVLLYPEDEQVLREYTFLKNRVNDTFEQPQDMQVQESTEETQPQEVP